MGIEQLLVALVSAYRYEGKTVRGDLVNCDAKALANAIKSPDKKSLLNDYEVLRILTTRSKPHLKVVCEKYKKLTDKNLDKVIITFFKSHYVCIYTSYDFKKLFQWSYITCEFTFDEVFLLFYSLIY